MNERVSVLGHRARGRRHIIIHSFDMEGVAHVLPQASQVFIGEIGDVGRGVHLELFDGFAFGMFPDELLEGRMQAAIAPASQKVLLIDTIVQELLGPGDRAAGFGQR